MSKLDISILEDLEFIISDVQLIKIKGYTKHEK